jgi:hypothetical protein
LRNCTTIGSWDVWCFENGLAPDTIGRYIGSFGELFDIQICSHLAVNKVSWPETRIESWLGPGLPDGLFSNQKSQFW